MSLSFVLVGSQIKRFRTALRALAAIGSELLVEGVPERLVLRSINSARSAFLAVTLSAQFFESYNLFAQTGLVQAGVLLKHLLATFRSSRVSSMAFELDPQQARLTVTLKCENGLLKCYGLDISSSDILQATLDGNDLPVSVVAEAGELNRLLNTFQSTLDEITIIAQPEQEPQDSTAAAAAAAEKAVQIKSFLDPTKGSSSSTLQTCLQLNSHEVFKSYRHSGVSPSDVTVNLKDLKALVALCVELNADVSLKFDKAGLPLLAVPHLRGAQEVDYTAELILATLQESQILDDEWTEDRAAAGHAPGAAGDGVDLGPAPGGMANGNGAAAAADRAETIAPATTFAPGGAAAGAAAGGDVTPQGGVGRPPGIIPFSAAQRGQQQQQQQQQGAAASAGGGRGGEGSAAAGQSGRSGAAAAAGSGGRFSRGSAGLSRLQRLEAEEAAEQSAGVAPYSRLTSSMATAAARSGGAGSGGSGGGFSGGAAGLRSPVGGVSSRELPQPQQQQQQQQETPAVQRQQAWQQWQQQQQGDAYASRSLGDYGAAAGVAARYQGAAAAGGGHGGVGGTDSQADDPEALPGHRHSVRHAYQQQLQHQHAQQLQQQQQEEQQGCEEQQQQPPGAVAGDGGDDSEELLPSEDADMQDAGGANFGFL